jgi:hypothetical protein
MDQIILPVLIAAVVACLVLGMWFMFGAGSGEKRRLQQRLSTERGATNSEFEISHTPSSLTTMPRGWMRCWFSLGRSVICAGW